MEYSDPKGGQIRRLSLTVWHLKSGAPNQLSLALKSVSNSHHIATVNGGQVIRAGTVTLQPEQPGDRFEVKGTDERDATIEAQSHVFMLMFCCTSPHAVEEADLLSALPYAPTNGALNGSLTDPDIAD